MEPQYQTPAQTPADPINLDDTPHFYSIKLLAKIKHITYFFILTQVPFVYMERAGFMTCTAASHQGPIKEPTASLLKMYEACEASSGHTSHVEIHFYASSSIKLQ